MYYITVLATPRTHQMSLEELLFSKECMKSHITNQISDTHTYQVEKISSKFKGIYNIDFLIDQLKRFNLNTEDLRNHPTAELYYEFFIPKKSGGLRQIDAPCDELKDALRVLKTIFERDFNALYHTSAFAYIKNRSTIDAVKRHQANESKWFAKYDLSNFFGSTTLDFVLKMFSMVYPFSEVLKREDGYEELSKALNLAFLNGELPQGTPISPLITNIMMIPIDFALSSEFRNHNKQAFIYTRYADDFLVSSKYDFDFKEVESYIKNVLESFDAPFEIKPQKTRYGSSSGSNWMLGVMLNGNNEITIGHKAKKRFETMLFSFAMDYKNGKRWSVEDVQHLEGIKSYYIMVEGDTIKNIIAHQSKKTGIDIGATIKECLTIRN